MNLFDVTIVGGGLAGTGLAAALRGYPGRVALVEARSPGVLRRDAFDQRSIALSDASRRILDTLGLWDALAAHAHPIRRIHVSEKGAFGVTRIDAAEEGLDALAWTVPHHVLSEALHDGLRGVERFSSARALAFTERPGSSARPGREGSVVLAVEHAGARREIETRLLVIADGGSGLRGAAGFGVAASEYGQAAVVVNVTTEVAAGATAYERFTPHGPLAVLPLGDRCGVVWTREKAGAETVAAWPDERFIEALQADFGYRLGRILRAGERSVFPLRLVRVSRMVMGRTAVLGNAAHTLHPVAGQNFNLALRCIAALAEGVSSEDDPGAGEMLAAWQSRCRADVRRVTRFTDFLARAFTSRWRVLSPLRGPALMGFELCPPLRRVVVRGSLGLLPPASRLASGLPLVFGAGGQGGCDAG